MNNLTRAISRAANPDWQYAWKLTLSGDLVRVVGAKARGPFQNRWLSISPVDGGRTEIRVLSGYSWDGCSVVPDAPGTHDASCAHDALYQFGEDIACSWGCKFSDVRAFADLAFSDLMRQDGCPVRGLYYAGVRIFGGAFHWLAKALSDRPQKPTWRGMIA